MDSKQIDEAMRRRLPVVCDGVQYDRIAEYVMWYGQDGTRNLSAVLIQKNCSMRVPAHKVELAETGGKSGK